MPKKITSLLSVHRGEFIILYNIIIVCIANLCAGSWVGGGGEGGGQRKLGATARAGGKAECGNGQTNTNYFRHLI